MEEIAARLMQVSGKTKESSEAYAVCTVRAAAAAIARREGRQR
jgi:hypothetical protein